MNRLVIIGNGFDLAHGLPTSYKDFIDDFWKNFKDYCKNEACQELVYTNNGYDRYYTSYNSIKNFDDFKSNIIAYCKDYPECHFEEKSLFFYTSKSQFEKKESIFEFKNNFFKEINKKNSETWVDIENEYYSLLKEIVNEKIAYSNPTLRDKEELVKRKKVNIERLNKEFDQVKNLLEKYLKEKVVEKYNFRSINSDFHDIFYPDILDDLKIDLWKKDFSKEDKEYIDELINEKNQDQIKLRFLNFNYTPTLSIYFQMNSTIYSDSEFFIHGKLNDTNNKINFGFGDEMDEDYKLIENIDDNEYLKNFKSFQYLQNDTYKKLMDFVESGKFEVFIIGSSCGLSDRTLLNTIFEHDNCRLIKVFYYQKENGTDNFTELTQNISRHFNDKKLMRSKIVHKKPEQLMPKIQLTKKE